MYSFDSSSVIYAWDTYPIKSSLFESFWKWFAENIENGQFVISKIALDETNHKIPELKEWLVDSGIEITIYNRELNDLHEVQKIKHLLDIEEDNYAKGVGENDLFIISIAKRNNTTLVTDEEKQPNLPNKKKSNYKIPAVCGLIGTKCISFNDLIQGRRGE